MRRVLSVLIGLLAFAFYGILAGDMWATLMVNEAYLDAMVAQGMARETIEWIQDFPLWRKVVWGASIGFGVLGAVSLLIGARIAGAFLWLAALAFVGGFVGHDLLMTNGAEMYGNTGMIANSGMVAFSFIFALLSGPLTKSSAGAGVMAEAAAVVAGAAAAHEHELAPDLTPHPEPEPAPVPVEEAAPAEPVEQEPPAADEPIEADFEEPEPEGDGAPTSEPDPESDDDTRH